MIDREQIENWDEAAAPERIWADSLVERDGKPDWSYGGQWGLDYDEIAQEGFPVEYLRDDIVEAEKAAAVREAVEAERRRWAKICRDRANELLDQGEHPIGWATAADIADAMEAAQ